MRTLTEPPSAVFDPRSRALATGSFRGGIPRVDATPLGKSMLHRVRHEKRWVYAAIAVEDLFIATAIVRLGYAANALAFAYDRRTGRMLADFSATAPAFAASVGDSASEGCRARFRWPGAELSVERSIGARDYRFEVATRDLTVSARLSSDGVPPPLGAIAALEGSPDLFDATQKTVLCPVIGEAVIGGARRDLHGGVGGIDYTNGYLARRTAWRWAFALGHVQEPSTPRPSRFAMNLVQGFVGAPECGVWVGDELVPVSEGVIDCDPDAPMTPWRVRTREGEVDLTFTPGAVHREEHDFRIVASRFIQPVGSFAGTLRLPGRPELRLEPTLGVVEDQRVLW